MLPFAPGGLLGHLGACAAVARVLRARGHDVTFAYGGSLPEVLDREGFAWRPVEEVAADRGADSTRWFDSADQVERVVRSNLGVVEALAPDVAVTSSGIAAGMACQLAGVPEVHLHHYLALTAYARPAVVWSQRRADLRHPRRIRRLVRSRLAARRPGPPVVERYREARRRLGLPDVTRPGAARPGALVACTTTPFLDPAEGLPPTWRYVGPLTWEAASGELPPRRRPDLPLVYVTQGSTGSRDLLLRAVAELGAEPVELLVSTGQLAEPAEVCALGARVSAERYLPGRACMEAAAAAVVHGGQLTMTEAMLADTPVMVLPSLRDQVRSLYRAERLGVGVGEWPPPAPRGAVRRGVRRLLGRPRYRRRTAELGERLRTGWDGARNSADLVEQVAVRGGAAQRTV
jgi:UDP:flavonoid glycosyltransferase YjiC (YdhE family)